MGGYRRAHMLHLCEAEYHVELQCGHSRQVRFSLAVRPRIETQRHTQVPLKWCSTTPIPAASSTMHWLLHAHHPALLTTLKVAPALVQVWAHGGSVHRPPPALYRLPQGPGRQQPVASFLASRCQEGPPPGETPEWHQGTSQCCWPGCTAGAMAQVAEGTPRLQRLPLT